MTRPGGLVAIFEHNPLNPLTRKAVRDCPFDEDAVLLSRGEARRRLAEAGLAEVEAPFIIFFPREGDLRSPRGAPPRLAATGRAVLRCGQSNDA